MKNEKILVTSALIYANGTPHFGHIAGAYLPADIFVRFKKLTRADVVFISGTDEHGFAITVAAQKEGNSPQEHVDKYYSKITDVFDKFNIQFDNFSRTSQKEHYKLSQQFFNQLLENNFIEAKVTDQLYAPSLNLFLADRYVEGTCPHCGNEEARGDECPGCGTWLDALELKDPRCSINGETPIIRSTKHWFLKLGDFEERLQTWLAGKPHWKSNVKNFIQNMIEQGLHSRAITRDMEWGVPVPLEEAKGKVLYVWFDAPIGYISSTKEWAKKQGKPESWKDYWEDENCRLVHFIGKDNLPFHCVVWPSMLMGQNEPFILPEDVPANEFYNLEGKQFSKSTGWFIELDDFFSKYSTDSIRYSIATNAPETKDSAFSWKDFQNRHNGELADVLGNFINRTLKFTASYFENKVPRKSTGVAHTKLSLQIEKTFTKIEKHYDTYQVRKACFDLMELAREGNRYFDERAPWKSRKEDIKECEATLFHALQLVKSLALLSYPIIPEASEKIWVMLGLSGTVKDVDWNTEKKKELTSGANLGVAEVLFAKIEDELIEKELQKLTELLDSQKKRPAKESKSPKKPHTAKATKNTEASNKNTDNLVTFDEVMNVKLRVAEITQAESISKSKKLLQLQVNLGTEQRQIVAGIKEHYPEPQELVGKKIIMVSNLKPAKLMGIESQGMLLAAKSKGCMRLITPDGEIPLGSEVS